MSITFTSTMTGASSDYLRYTWERPVLTDRYKDSRLLDFALVPSDEDFVKLTRGAYISVNSTVYPDWFTGYIINEPELSYLGSRNKLPVWGYRYHATSDEYILNLKPLGVQNPYLNVSMGSIIKSLANRLAPGVFDVTGVEDGPLVARYVVDSNKKFLDVTQEFCEAASFLFYAKAKKLYFHSQDKVSTTITLDGNDKHFTPSRLEIRPSSTPIINDVTVVGAGEPQTYMQEVFVGTGLDASFPLMSSVFGVESSVLIDEVFSGSDIDSAKWLVTGPLGLEVANGYLNSLGTLASCVQSVNPLPMEGRIRFTHGEWDFLPAGGTGVICGCWTETPNSGLTGCLYGLKVVDRVMQVVVNGVADTATVPLDSTKRYIFRTLVEFTKTSRIPQAYSYIDQAGIVTELAGSPEPDTAKWETLISEINPSTGTLSNQWTLQHTSVLTGVDDVFASYAPLQSDSLHATVTGITISTPVNATLETAELVPLKNASFEDWFSEFAASYWISEVGVAKEITYGNTGSCMRMDPAAGVMPLIEQTVSNLLSANTAYNVFVRLRRSPDMAAGSLRIALFGTGVTPTGLTVLATDIPYDRYGSFSGTLDTGLTTIPTDLTLRIWFTDGTNGQSLFVDDLIVRSEWKQQLIGPNEIDAMDGMSSIATIVSSGRNSNETYSGTPAYSNGQAQLVFFKDSVTRTSSIPPENQIIRLSYRSAGTAVGRVVDSTSIDTESDSWGDDGVRSVVRFDMVPKPRTAVECELAAATVVSEGAFTHYEGTYTQWSPYFDVEPRSGAVLKFTNLSSMADVQAEEINQVVTTLESDELFQHVLTFGKPDHIRRLLAKFDSPYGSAQKATVTSEPTSVDVTLVGTNFAPDVAQPVLIGWDANYIYMDAGQDLASGDAFEIRHTDQGWGPQDGKNLISREGIRTFGVARELRGKLFFTRHATASSVSRYSSGVHISFPVTETDSGQEAVVETSVDTVLNPVTQLVKVSATSGDVLITLPPIKDMSGKQITVVKVSGAGNVNVLCSGSDTLAGGGTSFTLTTILSNRVIKG